MEMESTAVNLVPEVAAVPVHVWCRRKTSRHVWTMVLRLCWVCLYLHISYIMVSILVQVTSGLCLYVPCGHCGPLGGRHLHTTPQRSVRLGDRGARRRNGARARWWRSGTVTRPVMFRGGSGDGVAIVSSSPVSSP